MSNVGASIDIGGPSPEQPARSASRELGRQAIVSIEGGVRRSMHKLASRRFIYGGLGFALCAIAVMSLAIHKGLPVMGVIVCVSLALGLARMPE